tara:strand:- start:46 stop:2796 length:2751 start_codon:yes stop_codon:yes gene_type:complete
MADLTEAYKKPIINKEIHDDTFNIVEKESILIVNSRDRDLTNETAFNFTINFGTISTKNKKKISIDDNLKNITSVELQGVILPNVYIETKKIVSLFDKNIINSTEKAMRFKRLSDLPYLLLNISELGNLNSFGSNKVINKSTFVLVLHDSVPSSNNNSGNYTKAGTTFTENVNLSNTAVADTDKTFLYFKDFSKAIIKYTSPQNHIGNLKVNITTPDGKTIEPLTDFLEPRRMFKYGNGTTSNPYKLRVKFHKYFSADEYRIGDRILFKSGRDFFTNETQKYLINLEMEKYSVNTKEELYAIYDQQIIDFYDVRRTDIINKNLVNPNRELEFETNTYNVLLEEANRLQVIIDDLNNQYNSAEPGTWAKRRIEEDLIYYSYYMNLSIQSISESKSIIKGIEDEITRISSGQLNETDNYYSEYTLLTTQIDNVKNGSNNYITRQNKITNKIDKLATFYQYLEREVGHSIIGVSNDNKGAVTKLCNIIDIPFDSQITMDVNQNVNGASVLNTLDLKDTGSAITRYYKDLRVSEFIDTDGYWTNNQNKYTKTINGVDYVIAHSGWYVDRFTERPDNILFKNKVGTINRYDIVDGPGIVRVDKRKYPYTIAPKLEYTFESGGFNNASSFNSRLETEISDYYHSREFVVECLDPASVLDVAVAEGENSNWSSSFLTEAKRYDIETNGTGVGIYDYRYSKFGLGIGSYTLENIPSEHPMALISDSSFIYFIDYLYTDTITNETLTIDGVERNLTFYTGNIKIIVTGDFDEASIYCKNHGYMGGENRFIYSEGCIGEDDVEEIISTTIFIVTVDTGTNSFGSGNKFYIDGSIQNTLDLEVGRTYVFKQFDSSNTGHKLLFSTTPNGSHAFTEGSDEYNTAEYDNGIEYIGETPGTDYAVKFTVTADMPTLYYYCENHPGMGNHE